MSTTQKVAVITGANRGLGFEASRQLAKKGFLVVLTSRDEAKGKAAAEQLQAEGLNVIFHLLDVTNNESSQKLAEFIHQEFGKLDVLVNNAAIYIDSQADGNSVFDAKVDTLRQTMENDYVNAGYRITI
jgi:NAD(P)-dependent dehydrogenase (short-subunit alcohol dehydrogenase family)